MISVASIESLTSRQALACRVPSLVRHAGRGDLEAVGRPVKSAWVCTNFYIIGFIGLTMAMMYPGEGRLRWHSWHHLSSGEGAVREGRGLASLYALIPWLSSSPTVFEQVMSSTCMLASSAQTPAMSRLGPCRLNPR